MSELLILGLKLLFLALLWLFVLFALNVIRTDLFGRKVAAAAIPEVAGTPEPRRGRASKREPTALRVTSGPQTGLVLPLGDAFLIGRTHESTLVLDDQFMSTNHARITRTPKGYVVEDLGSRNGTFVNDKRIADPTPLRSADVLKIGQTTMSLDR